MADRRFPRSRVPDVRTTDRVTVRDQPVDRAVPQVKGPGPEAFAGLSAAFGNFFNQGAVTGLGLLQAAHTVDSIEATQDLRDHQQEQKRLSEDLARKGQLDAELGRAQDPSRALFKDYGDAYQSTLGTVSALKAADKWRNDVLSSATPDSDIEALTDRWVKENLQPTGNDVRDLYEAATFRKAVTQEISRFRVDQVRAQRLAGISSAHAAFVGRLGVEGATPELVRNFMDTFRTLDPMAPQVAPGRVVAALLDWAQADPKRAAEVDRVLRAPGLGPNGGAMIDLPGVADQAAKLVNLHQNALTLAGAKAYNDLTDRVKDLKSADDFFDFRFDLERARELHGADAKYVAVKNQMEARLEKWMERETKINRVEGMANGQLPVDPSEVRSQFAGLLERRRIDLVKQPLEVAQLVARLGEADDTTKHSYSQWMINPGDPEKRMAALSFWSAVESRLGRDAAMALLPASAQDFYLAFSDLARNDPSSWQNVLAKLDENREALKDAKSVSWSRLLPAYSTDAEAEKAVDNRIKSALSELHPGLLYNGTVRVDEATLRDLRSSLRIQMVLRQRDGIVVDGDATKDIVRGQIAAGRFEAIPGEDGQLQLRAVPNMAAIPNRVGFGKVVYNPATKQTEDTVETYQQDLGKFAKALPGLFGSGVSVNPNDPLLSTHGIYGVQRGGIPLVLAPGDKVSVRGSTTVTLGESLDVVNNQSMDTIIAAQLSALAPDTGFVLIPQTDHATGLTVYQVGYKPRLKGRPATAEERELTFRPTADPRSASTIEGIAP